MPFKCAVCDKIVQTMDQAECECQNPFFVKCEVVHFLSYDGPGDAYGKSYAAQGAVVGDDETAKPLTVRNLQPLRLGCNMPKQPANKVVHKSIMSSIVSCPDCLAFIETRRTKVCQSSEARTTDSTTDSTSETPKSDSVSPTATMVEQLISTQ